jgi:hypothetical protein
VILIKETATMESGDLGFFAAVFLVIFIIRSVNEEGKR